MKYAGLLFFSLFMALVRIQSGDVSAEIYPNTSYDVVYSSYGIACIHFGQNGPTREFTSTKTASGTWYSFPIVIGLTRWHVDGNDGSHTTGYTFFHEGYIYAIYTAPSGNTQILAGIQKAYNRTCTL